MVPRLGARAGAGLKGDATVTARPAVVAATLAMPPAPAVPAEAGALPLTKREAAVAEAVRRAPLALLLVGVIPSLRSKTRGGGGSAAGGVGAAGAR